MRKKYCKVCHYVIFSDEIAVIEGIHLDDIHKFCVRFLIRKEINRQKRVLKTRQYNLAYRLKKKSKPIRDTSSKTPLQVQ